MKLLSRYVFRQASSAVLIIVLSLSGMVWISIALRQLNVVTTNSQSAFAFLGITLLGLPSFMAVIAPLALLIGTIHVLTRLSTDSELIIVNAAGGTAWVAARPLLVLALIIATFVASINVAGMPWSARLLRDLVIKMRADLVSQVLQPGRFTSPESGLTLHMQERDRNGELIGLLIHDSRTPKESRSYLAERGTLVEQDGKAYLVLNDGHLVLESGNESSANIVAFKSLVVDLERFEAKTTGPPEIKAREFYLDELIDAIPKSKDRREYGRNVAELHERLSSPLYAFAFVFTAVAAIGRAKSVRQNRMQMGALAFAMAVGARLLGLAANNFVASKPHLYPLLYAIPVGLSAVSILALLGAGRVLQWRPSPTFSQGRGRHHAGGVSPT